MERVGSTFTVALLCYVRTASVRRELARLLAHVASPFQESDLSNDRYEYAVHVVEDEPALANKVIELLYRGRQAMPVVIISDALLERCEGVVHYSRAADVVSGAFLANAIPSALVALDDGAEEPPRGLVARLATTPLDAEKLREAVGRAALRLHLLAPARPPGGGVVRLARDTGARFSFRLAETPEQLLSSFEMRHRIYDIMGYLPKEVRESGLGLELDFHDGMSLHYLALDELTGAIAATIRLVIPHQPWGVVASIAPELKEAFQAQQSWVRRLAEAIPAPALQRRLLDSGVGALPLLQNARVAKAWRSLVEQGLSGVELSRSIVLPKYRGEGLSRVLVQLALAAAYDLGRRLVFAECFPSHAPMYRRYGFSDIEGREATAQTWGGGFGYTPQGMLLELSRESARETQVARWTSALFKMANPRLLRPGETETGEKGNRQWASDR